MVGDLRPGLKEAFRPVDGREVLARLVEVPITTWNLKAQDPSIRHIGPVAQDFYGAFGVGEDPRYITTTDADGVALAAIQGLHDMVKAQEARIADLTERLESVKGFGGGGWGPDAGSLLAGAAGAGLLALPLLWRRRARRAPGPGPGPGPRGRERKPSSAQSRSSASGDLARTPAHATAGPDRPRRGRGGRRRSRGGRRRGPPPR